MKEIQTTAIIGLGALGMLYGGQISAFDPDAVCFVADEGRAAKYREMHFEINGQPCRFQIKSPEQAGIVDLLIVATKFTGLEAALETAAPCVGPDTTIISVINGISSEEVIGEKFGKEKVIPCIAQGMDAVKFGSSLTYSRPGALYIGTADSGTEERLEALTAYFKKTGVPFVVEEDIRYRLWAKFMLNVGINQTCMVYETTYGGILNSDQAFQTMVTAMEEVRTLANLEGILLTEAEINSYVDLVRTLSPEGMPSMRQDGLAHRPSEVEIFAGTVRRLAAKHGLSVPVNDWLYERVKEMEGKY